MSIQGSITELLVNHRPERVLQPSRRKNEKFPVPDVIDYPDHAGSGLNFRGRSQQLRNVDVGVRFVRLLRENQ